MEIPWFRRGVACRGIVFDSGCIEADRNLGEACRTAAGRFGHGYSWVTRFRPARRRERDREENDYRFYTISNWMAISMTFAFCFSMRGGRFGSFRAGPFSFGSNSSLTLTVSSYVVSMSNLRHFRTPDQPHRLRASSIDLHRVSLSSTGRQCVHINILDMEEDIAVLNQHIRRLRSLLSNLRRVREQKEGQLEH
ncbi:uncharacterized protein BT62DRAFT_462279 [Guyanagaster necrorhizus]|uniref:Uncharacterized protein n=1 Tax=Guyanagaster necrorhizus TaxID=856835 RepID=A0A9P7VL87_9AGAR|nr:uncharacterized protein BT62DRAFT_462279 [Guyanagaster necrorhizus MCA 3950]KAG7441974.1 hypothetical protein BT62DRAFT_462279 [Guyanagaster necrorhizus MCA 3950]